MADTSLYMRVTPTSPFPLLRNYSTKPSYIFQLKRQLKVWKYIFNLFHFEMLIQNRNPKFRPLCLFVLTFHEYEARFVFGFRLDYKLSLFIFFFLCVKLLCLLFRCYNQYKLNNSSDPRQFQQLQLYLNVTFIRFLHFFSGCYT